MELPSNRAAGSVDSAEEIGWQAYGYRSAYMEWNLPICVDQFAAADYLPLPLSILYNISALLYAAGRHCIYSSECIYIQSSICSGFVMDFDSICASQVFYEFPINNFQLKCSGN